MLIGFRDHLLRHKTLEAAYADLVRNGIGKTPPLFVNQLVHVILRNALDGVDRRARGARGRNVLPHPARDHARGLAARRRRGNHRRRQYRAGDAAGLDAGHSGRSRDRRHQRRQRRQLLGTQRPVRHGARSDRRARRARRARRSDAALDRACARRRGDDRAAHRAARRAALLVCRARRRRHQDRRHVVERRGDRRGGHGGAWSGCSRSLSAIRRSCWTRSKASRSI